MATQPVPPPGFWTSTHRSLPDPAVAPVRMTVAAEALNAPTIEALGSGPERMASPSGGVIRITAYGPDGVPVTVATGLDPGVGVTDVTPVVAEGAWIVAEASVGATPGGVAEAATGVNPSGVEEGRNGEVGNGGGVPRKLTEQLTMVRKIKPAANAMTLPFMGFSFW